MSTKTKGVRTSIYLASPVAAVIERVKTEYLERYGSAITVSAVLARLILGETITEVVERPYRTELARIASEMNTIRDDLRRAQARRRVNDLHRLHREIAELYPRVKQIANTLDRARRRNEPPSPDFAEAGRIEESLNDLMGACADAIVPRRRR
ncbi:MAG: hypothetical protein H0W68_09540 [Gemmatimonadaceae bacterium]|nr:hypothetical protein [Gemmatimonadaceae bacterium]